MEAGPRNEYEWTAKDALNRYLRRSYTHPFAIAVWWTHVSVTVICPYCQGAHSHGCLPPNYHDLTSRVAHCGDLTDLCLSYNILFPFSEHPKVSELALSFEIDEAENRFKTIGIDARMSIRDSIDNLVGALQACTLSHEGDDEDSDEERTRHGIGDDQRLPFLEENEEAMYFVASCISKQLHWAQALYDNSSNRSRLIYEKDRAGDTALSMTAAKGHDEVVKFLLEKGANIDTINEKGRTPLMEAALCGRPAVVKRLVRAGASINIKDRSGCTALDLARKSGLNEDGWTPQSLTNSNRPDTWQQRIIVALLGGTFPQTCHKSGIPSITTVSEWIHKAEVAGTLPTYIYTLLAPVVQIPVERMDKTVAFLNRGTALPIVRAKSGWADRTGDPDYLDSYHWTKEVKKLAKAMEFELVSHKHDQGEPGRYYASHAENQLIAFLYQKHFYSEDVHLARLALVQLPRAFQEVTILVSQPVCTDCEAFLNKFEDKYKLTIHVKVLRMVR
ncbi:hypothetical protein MMC14_006647 [Varicellaria rhodocarpa]|nr:hypothetical protein [Varicellaria rhodocarpa]